MLVVTPEPETAANSDDDGKGSHDGIISSPRAISSTNRPEEETPFVLTGSNSVDDASVSDDDDEDDEKEESDDKEVQR